MIQRQVGSSLSLSRIVLGTAGYGTGFQDDAAFAQMDRYFESGGRTLDTARVYGMWAPDGDGASKKCVGKWLRARGVRNQVVISTKGAHHDLHDIRHKRVTPACIRQDLDESLDFLGVDTVDLYFLHRDDPRIPVSEIMDVLHEQVSAGKIRVLGASNWSVSRIAEANAYAARSGKTPFYVSQIEWSAAKLERQIYDSEDSTQFMNDENFAWYSTLDFPVMAYSSQAKGLFSKLIQAPDRITGVFAETYATPVNRKRAVKIAELAGKYGVSLGRMALAVLLCNPLRPCAIIGASNMSQLEDSLAAASISLSTDELSSVLDGTSF